MTYLAELDDDFRQQLRYGAAGQRLRYWPKVRGVGNVQVTGSAATFEARRPGDSSTAPALASGACTVTTNASGDMLAATLDLTSTNAWPMNTHYQLSLSWTYAGDAHVSTIYFDVVHDPWEPDVSLNDVAEEVADAGQRLLAQADRISAGRTAEAHASVLGVKAWGDVLQWLRRKVEASVGLELLPMVVADRETLRRATVAQAISRMYLAEGGAPGSESMALSERWAKTARERFESMGPLRYSEGIDRQAFAQIGGFGVVRVGRSWPSGYDTWGGTVANAY